jgi:hypothetical protein
MCLTDAVHRATELAGTEAKNKGGLLLSETHTVNPTLCQKKSGDALVQQYAYSLSFSKKDLSTPHAGHTQSSGSSSNGTPSTSSS